MRVGRLKEKSDGQAVRFTDQHWGRAVALDRATYRFAPLLLGPGDAAVLGHVLPGVFDHAIDPRFAAEFFADPRHHLAAALDGETVVGTASALHYAHPDKPPKMDIKEVGVASAYRNRGIGRELLKALFAHDRVLGCTEGLKGAA